jgi:CP family cyanate transporter-like MFS transporter
MHADADAPPATWLAATLLWLAGNTLRLTILAVPPVLATIRDDFHLSATEVGMLSSVPPALFAIAALLGSLLVSKLGVKRALVGGLVLIAAGSALRGVAPSFAMLFAMTVLMSAGVAVMQPIMPSAVRQWMPRHVGTGTALYTNGLLIGEILPVMFATSLVLPLVGGSWRGSLVLWSVPIVLIAIVVALAAPHDAARPAAARALPAKWLPDWHKGLVWRLGGLFCCFNATYFSTNAFLPIYLASHGRSDLIGPALTALNFGQLPASLLLLATAGRVERKAWPYVACGVLSVAGVAGIVLDVGSRTILWSSLVGFANAAALIIGLTLPPLLCHRDDVARTAAGTFTISYGSAVVLSIAGGALWDAIGVPALAFVPIAGASLALVLIPLVMRRKGELL